MRSLSRRAEFLFGFAKSDRDNIDADELDVVRANAGQWLADSNKIARDAAAGILIEVKDDDDKKSRPGSCEKC